MLTKTLTLSFVFFVLVSSPVLSQMNNPTEWPYGGTIDRPQRPNETASASLKFSKAEFYSAKFDTPANFEKANFEGEANFHYASFESLANFTWSKFSGQAEFDNAVFKNRAIFLASEFSSQTSFINAEFNKLAYFQAAGFANSVIFNYAQFDSLAHFKFARFDQLTQFRAVTFHSTADFSGATFENVVIFRHATFNKPAIFNSVNFKRPVDFSYVKFNDQLDLRNASMGSFVDFSLAQLRSSMFVGIPNSSRIQKYDLMRALLLPPGRSDSQYPGAKIILNGPVDLKIQLEKFNFIALCDTLNYYTKKDIISTLKTSSFQGEQFKNERFELDYLLAQSTKYQKKSPYYETYGIFHPVRWERFLYDISMGMGYRPFRLIWWILGFIIVFALYFSCCMKDQINSYIVMKFGRKKPVTLIQKARQQSTYRFSPGESVLNSFYFSTLLLLAFHLSGDVLTFFNNREKRVIIFEYVLGIFIYFLFLTLSKSGSILHALKSFFLW